MDQTNLLLRQISDRPGLDRLTTTQSPRYPTQDPASCLALTMEAVRKAYDRTTPLIGDLRSPTGAISI
jgi:hypothetical protein